MSLAYSEDRATLESDPSAAAGEYTEGQGFRSALLILPFTILQNDRLTTSTILYCFERAHYFADKALILAQIVGLFQNVVGTLHYHSVRSKAL